MKLGATPEDLDCLSVQTHNGCDFGGKVSYPFNMLAGQVIAKFSGDRQPVDYFLLGSRQFLGPVIDLVFQSHVLALHAEVQVPCTKKVAYPKSNLVILSEFIQEIV